jgi:hypothetical protein
MSAAVFGSCTLFAFEVVKDGILFNINWMGVLSLYCGLKACQWMFQQPPWKVPSKTTDTIINLYNYVDENVASADVDGEDVPQFYELKREP